MHRKSTRLTKTSSRKKNEIIDVKFHCNLALIENPLGSHDRELSVKVNVYTQSLLPILVNSRHRNIRLSERGWQSRSQFHTSSHCVRPSSNRTSHASPRK